MKKTNYSFIAKAFIFGLLFLLSNRLHAQSKDSAKKQLPKASIVLNNGATLYSADSAFNSQISANKIITEKAAVSYQKDKKGIKTLKMLTPKTDSAKTVSKQTLDPHIRDSKPKTLKKAKK